MLLLVGELAANAAHGVNERTGKRFMKETHHGRRCASQNQLTNH